MSAATAQALNDFGRSGYGGPCPPRSHGPHHYHFWLLALSTDHLRVRKNPVYRDVEREARRHLLAEAVLVGQYEPGGEAAALGEYFSGDRSPPPSHSTSSARCRRPPLIAFQ